MFLSSTTRLTLAIAAAILALGSPVRAADSDVATVRIIANGVEERVEVALHELAVGESRQLTAASGSPAIVTRTEDGLSVEVAGKRTEVRFPGQGGDMTWVDGGAAGKQLRVVRLNREGEIGEHGEAGQKVIVLKRGAGDVNIDVITEDLRGADGEISADRIRELISEVESGGTAGNGEQVIVTRRMIKQSETQD